MSDYLTEDHLSKVAQNAVDQCLIGKGKERHGHNTSLQYQPIWQIAQNVGTGFPIGQAIKKLMELKIHEGKAWRKEAVGAIVYTMFAIMWHDYIESKEEKNEQDNNTSAKDTSISHIR